jgi:translation initiation factor 4E
MADTKPEAAAAAQKEEGEVERNDGAPEFDQKHMLENRWTLWFDNPQAKQSKQAYGNSVKQVYTFDTVEDFWW